MNDTSRNIKVVVSGFLPLVGLIILSIFAFKFGLGKVSEVRGRVSQGRNDLNVLQTKLNLLRELQATVSTSSSIASIALPSENPALTVLNQLKNVASQSGVTVGNIKTGAESKNESGLSSVDVTMDVSGARPQIFQFISSISKIAPISRIAQVKLNESEGTGRATIVIKSFWAALPTSLPAFNQEIGSLSAEDINVITDISGLVQPSFTQIPPSQSTGGGKADPFSL